MTQPALVLPGDREWMTVSESMKAAGIAPGQRVRFMGMLTPEEGAEIERLKNSQFFLVHNGYSRTFDTIEPMKCDRCGAGRYPTKAHPYLTYMCIERPFRGLAEALYCLSSTRGDNPALEKAVFDWVDFATLHPFTARQYQDPYSKVLLSFAVGATVPIPPEHARRLANTINGRRPEMRFVL